MTREEAINILAGLYVVNISGNEHFAEQRNEAIDMAIEALQAEAVEYETIATINEPISIQSNYVYVVRCKDCRHRHDDNCPMYYMEWFTVDEGDGFYSDDYNIIDKTKDDGYCSFGELAEQTVKGGDADIPKNQSIMQQSRHDDGRTHGEWIEVEDDYDNIYWECSNCEDAFVLEVGTPKDNNYNFCPNCGAKMYKGGDDK